MFRSRSTYWLVVSLMLLVAVAGWQPSEAKAETKFKCPKSRGGLMGSTTYEKGFHFFLRHGFTPVESAALIGNFRWESSNMNPGVTNYIGARGIAQWYKGRRDRMEAFARKRGVHWSDLKTQLYFVLREFRTTETKAYRKIKQADSLYEASLAVRIWYERPGQHEKHDAERISLARDVYARAKEAKFCGLWKNGQPTAEPNQPKQQQQKQSNGNQQRDNNDLVARVTELIDINTDEISASKLLNSTWLQLQQNRQLQVLLLIVVVILGLRVFSSKPQPDKT